MEEAPADVSYGSGEVEEHTVKSEEEEEVSEEQKDDAATDKLRVVQNNNNNNNDETTGSAVKRMPTAATQTVVTKEGTCDNDELKESVAETKEEQEELMTTSPNGVTKEEEEELMTTSFDYVTKKDKSDMMASGGLETQMAVKEDLDESNGGHCGGRAVADHLDELMDMGAVDQEEQEALMKDEEEDVSDSDDSWPTTDAVEKETRPSSLDSSIKVVKVAMEEADDHMLQTATPPRLRSPAEDPPSPSLVTVKDEPIDEEYNQALFSSSSAPTDDIKDEPETPKIEHQATVQEALRVILDSDDNISSSSDPEDCDTDDEWAHFEQRLDPAEDQLDENGMPPAKKCRGHGAQEAPSWHTRKDADVAPPTMRFHPARPPGVQLSSADTRTPLDLFKLFFSENTIKTLCSNTNKQELMISSVFSVEGKSSSSRLTLRPTPSMAKAIPLPASARTSSTLCVVCSLCKKFLIKGQTAYQKKGSPELFCSPICLSAKPQEPATKICHHCHKSLLRPQDLILAPTDSGSIREFCSANCLAGFNNAQAASLKAKNPAPVPNKCSMCKKSVRTSNKHEVELQGVTHHICSNACFCRFRTIHKLNVSTCVSCGEYFASKILMLSTTGGNKSLCSDACLATFKKQSTTSHACSMCSTVTLLADTVHTANNLGVVEIFCTTGCLLAHKIQSISSSGTLFPCDNCEMQKVPAYHLAMSDSSIRNFCSLPCVLGFQEKHHKAPKGGTTASQYPIVSVARENATAAVPAAAIAASAIPRQAIPTPTILRPANTTTTTSTSSLKEASSKSPTPKLECPMCDQAIVSYPEVIQEKDKMVFLCGLECAEKFKVVHCWESRCEYCKLLKVPADVKRIGSKNCSFCSEGCKLLYKHELSKQWGSHCRCCAYCFSISRSQVTTRYSGKMEEFCSEHCRNKYTLLIQKLAMCETCHSRGKLSMTLPLLGNPKRFCRLQCLLKFCCAQRTQDQTPAKKREAEALASSDLESTPVIANVISLASRLPTQPNAPPSVAQQGTAVVSTPSIQMKTLGHAGTQTDTVKAPPPPVKSLKNKALLCRPMVQHQGVTCKPDMVDTEVQTDEPIRVIMVPVPVPVYVPVPMAMYSQYCPAPMSMPLPLPVPMMLPVTLDSAERVVETIRQIKDKIPADPLEADLILMAEIVAEQEEREGKEERERRGRVQEEKVKEERGGKKKKAEKRTRAVEEEKDGLDLLNEYINNYSSSDLDPEIPDSLLGTWQDSPSAIGLQTDSRPLAREKLQPIRDIPVGDSLELPVQSPPPGPLPMDIEADIPVETLEQLETARLNQKKQSDAKRRVVPNRRQRKARDKKRGRPAAEAPESSEVASRAPKLESKYGIDAWERWVRWRKSQPDLQTPCINSRPLELKEDVLRCTTTELSYGLCRFTMEVKRPNGEPYLPDSLFYLCLGIQQHLFENGRVENIFTDVFYNKFSMEITKLLKDFKPSITRSGYIHSRVEEEYLWDCKQLGAYSPIVLLNTLLFFCSKYLGFTTVRQHRRLSFAHFMRCSRNNPDNTKTIFLRFYPPVAASSTAKQQSADTDGSAAKRSRQDEEKMLDMVENQENPLRCPIRLYEFYLSKCSETVKQRSNVFYLRPERSCVPNSPLWFSGTSLDDVTLGGMLTRILSVREMHLSLPSDNAAAEKDDPPYTPNGDQG